MFSCLDIFGDGLSLIDFFVFVIDHVDVFCRVHLEYCSVVISLQVIPSDHV